MKTLKPKDPLTPDSVIHLAAGLGARIRAARTRRGFRREDLASRAGLSRTAVEAVEAGKLTTGLGTYLRALWAMGLADAIDLVADLGLDREGIALEYDSQSKRVRPGRGKVDNDF